ncbi:uncharacterized protein LOC135486147 isoform X2 [Lineus longissimus]|uniref:uncharacterized protein LOC135486147 isoform X2 n=1 Tax=Lineus longissimus TaxID=88925 RepID=UPI00315C7550
MRSISTSFCQMFLFQILASRNCCLIHGDEGIDEEAFCMLDDEIIKELIPKIGTRMKFARKYRNLLLCNSHDSSLGIEQDYKILFANNDFMTRRWDTVFASKVISYTDSAKPSWREMVPVKKELSNLEQSVVAMQLLPIMLPPRPTKGHRPSVTEAMSSFIQFKQDLPSGAVQPFVLALGDRTSPTQAFLIIEKNALEYPTLLKAVEACFRLCMFLT